MGIALLLFLLQDPSLVDRLGDDDPAVRGAAFEALEKRGDDAIPDLEKALKHSSPEVRLRATELLNRVPKYQGRHLERHAAYKRAERIWNALIDCVVHRKPVPRALAKELGDPVIHHRQAVHDEPEAPHAEDWILDRLAESGGVDVRYLSQKYGIEGKGDDLLVPINTRVRIPDLPDLLPRLAALRPDWETLEEIYATLRILWNEGMGAWGRSFADRDWETALVFLVRIRRRADAKPAAPLDPKEAMERIRRGPWLRGLASGLGRAFANKGKKYARASCQIAMVFPPPRSTWSGVERIYTELLDLDQDISRCWFWRERLRPAKAAIPKGPWALPQTSREALDKLRLDGPARNVVAAILEELPERRWNETEVGLLREIGLQVAREASK